MKFNVKRVHRKKNESTYTSTNKNDKQNERECTALYKIVQQKTEHEKCNENVKANDEWKFCD